MQTKLIVFPNDEGFSVLIWEKATAGTMRVRRFENRATMIALLQSLRLINSKEASELNQFDFVDSCPMYSADIDEDMLVAHAFQKA